MATRFRLARFGSKGHAFYRIVVADSRCSRNSSCLEVVGNYDPAKGQKEARVNWERVKHWQACGVKATSSVAQILKRATAGRP